MKDLLLKNEKMMWAWKEQVQILVAICVSLPVIAEEVALLWAAGVTKPDATIIMGITISSGEPGTSNGGITPQGARIIGALALAPHWIAPHFLHPLALPASCISASNWDSASNTKMESNSSNGSGREPCKVCPLTLRFSGCVPKPLTEGSVQGPGPNDHVVHYLTLYC